MSPAAARRPIRCPALGRALSLGLAVLALFGCNYIPRTVEGVPAEAPWAALPLRGWLVEGPVAPEAMTICRPPECRPGLAVAVLDVAGPDADEAEAVLRRPAGLARALSGPGGKPRKIETIAEARLSRSPAPRAS